LSSTTACPTSTSCWTRGRHASRADPATHAGRCCTLEGGHRATGGHRVWVQAVVVFWSRFPEGLVEDDRCVWVHGT
jgi:hypothetical protein